MQLLARERWTEVRVALVDQSERPIKYRLRQLMIAARTTPPRNEASGAFVAVAHHEPLDLESAQTQPLGRAPSHQPSLGYRFNDLQPVKLLRYRSLGCDICTLPKYDITPWGLHATSNALIICIMLNLGKCTARSENAFLRTLVVHVDYIAHVAHLVKDATRALVRALQMRLAEHAVSFVHWTFLRILWGTDGLTQRELSMRAGVMDPTTFAAVKAMETPGYVERQQMLDNKKNVHVFLTAEGRALKDRLVPLAEEVNEISVAGLSERDIKTARKVLLAVIENLADDESGSANPKRRVASTRELGRLIAERGHTPEDT